MVNFSTSLIYHWFCGARHSIPIINTSDNYLQINDSWNSWFDHWWNSLAVVLVTYCNSLRSQPHFWFTAFQGWSWNLPFLEHWHLGPVHEDEQVLGMFLEQCSQYCCDLNPDAAIQVAMPGWHSLGSEKGNYERVGKKRNHINTLISYGSN